MASTPPRQQHIQHHPLTSPTPSTSAPSSPTPPPSSSQQPQSSSHAPPSPSASAVPILKVMRLQSPDLGQSSAGSLGTLPTSTPSLSLPDSFGVIHIGETFTAYLGAINPSHDLYVLHLTVTAQLQTPSRRFSLPTSSSSQLNAEGGVNVPPGAGVDAIVSRSLEEVGQHILRVEVGHSGNKTLRKFYRFHVASPLHIRELTVRSGDATCFVSIAIENATSGSALTIKDAEFTTPDGLKAERIDGGPPLAKSKSKNDNNNDNDKKKVSALALYDNCGRLPPGASFRYLFKVYAHSHDATLRGIACGDELGKAVFTWRKTMGESGRIASTFVLCPPSHPPGLLLKGGGTGASSAAGVAGGTMGGQSSGSSGGSSTVGGGGGGASEAMAAAAAKNFVVHGSGLSVDAATAAANKSAFRSPDDTSSSSNTNNNNNNNNNNNTQSTPANPKMAAMAGLDEILPVTVEPVDPPRRMTLAVPQEVQLLVVNHSEKVMDLQLQMRLAHMSGVVVCGPSFRNLGQVPGSGGSYVVGIHLVPLVAGLFRAQGCFLVDLNTGKEIAQPPLFHVFVDKTADQ